MIKVSIIVPVYNSEKYLEECIQSCIQQTMQEVEIILIDDASTDNSTKIINKYVGEYPQKVKAIYCKYNQRQGAARNKGIKASRGEFLCFVDSDDYIDKEMCKKLYEIAKRDNADIVSTDGYKIQGESVEYYNQLKKYDFEKKNSIQNFTSQCYMIIKRKIIVENNLFYPEKILHEDTAVVPAWYFCANKISFLENGLYYYRVHEESTTQTLDLKGVLEISEVLSFLINNLKNCNQYEINRDLVDCFVFGRITAMLKLFIKYNFNQSYNNILKLKNEVEKWKKYMFCETYFYNHMTEYEIEFTKEVINDPLNFPNILWGEYQENNYKNGYIRLENKIKDLIQKINNDRREIVIWGYGDKAKTVLNIIERVDVAFYITDKNSNLWDKTDNHGRRVYSPKDIKETVVNPVFLIMVSECYTEIKHEIKSQFENCSTVDFFSYIKYNLTPEEVY